MKSIGILTFWNVPNYGAFMQAYALQRFLEKRFPDYEVKQIPYLNKRHYDTYYSKSMKSQFSHWYVNPHYYKALINKRKDYQNIESLKNFLSYYDTMISHFDCDKIRTLKLDNLILGSDIIWDYSVPFFGNDKHLFGLGINAKNRISYAPGFGSIETGSNAPEYVIRGLKELNAISVRDEKSARIVKNLISKDATVVLDPTLLWDFENDDKVIKPIEKMYIVVYGSFFSDELIKEARAYADKHQLKLLCLSSLDDKFEWCDKVINQDEMNPFEWVGYFKYADAVMTCTYHGLLFSLIFKKRIIFYMTDFIWKKSESLVNGLGLTKVLKEYKFFYEKIGYDWDYEIISDVISKLRMQSIQYIDCSIIGKEC